MRDGLFVDDLVAQHDAAAGEGAALPRDAQTALDVLAQVGAVVFGHGLNDALQNNAVRLVGNVFRILDHFQKFRSCLGFGAAFGAVAVRADDCQPVSVGVLGAVLQLPLNAALGLVVRGVARIDDGVHKSSGSGLK